MWDPPRAYRLGAYRFVSPFRSRFAMRLENHVDADRAGALLAHDQGVDLEGSDALRRLVAEAREGDDRLDRRLDIAGLLAARPGEELCRLGLAEHGARRLAVDGADAQARLVHHLDQGAA